MQVNQQDGHPVKVDSLLPTDDDDHSSHDGHLPKEDSLFPTDDDEHFTDDGHLPKEDSLFFTNDDDHFTDDDAFFSRTLPKGHKKACFFAQCSSKPRKQLPLEQAVFATLFFIAMKSRPVCFCKEQ